MKNLKILRCPLAKCFRNHHLVAIADALPWLEELGIQFSGNNFDSKSAKYMVTDAGIEVMSRKLRRLRKIDITGQMLDPIPVYKIDSFTFENSMTYATSLRDLVLEPYGDHDRILSSISTVGIPLEKILIYEDSGLSLHGLTTFLCACPSLTHLTLHDIDFLNDDSMRDLCQYLSSLVYIKLSCSTLTATTFFLLTKECPLLSEIDLGFLKLQVEDDLDMAHKAYGPQQTTPNPSLGTHSITRLAKPRTAGGHLDMEGQWHSGTWQVIWWNHPPESELEELGPAQPIHPRRTALSVGAVCGKLWFIRALVVFTIAGALLSHRYLFLSPISEEHCNYFKFVDDDDYDMISNVAPRTSIRSEEFNDPSTRVYEMDNEFQEHAFGEFDGCPYGLNELYNFNGILFSIIVDRHVEFIPDMLIEWTEWTCWIMDYGLNGHVEFMDYDEHDYEWTC
ncbi:hypothetical protein TEA_029504 [Camellia sinensis var. sinensis]|uniref:Uncharacterized protein n=1 Tax=Camellia sinensis var. sinensis TaxID=542762 RepID=A0A4S4DTX8_CAMSN|nr:hypothetical protein TEA_029504 [Camellia sinensis var. sinensis]